VGTQLPADAHRQCSGRLAIAWCELSLPEHVRVLVPGTPAVVLCLLGVLVKAALGGGSVQRVLAMLLGGVAAALALAVLLVRKRTRVQTRFATNGDMLGALRKSMSVPGLQDGEFIGYAVKGACMSRARYDKNSPTWGIDGGFVARCCELGEDFGAADGGGGGAADGAPTLPRTITVDYSPAAGARPADVRPAERIAGAMTAAPTAEHMERLMTMARGDFERFVRGKRAAAWKCSAENAVCMKVQ
jgi:hypothetical protein